MSRSWRWSTGNVTSSSSCCSSNCTCTNRAVWQSLIHVSLFAVGRSPGAASGRLAMTSLGAAGEAALTNPKTKAFCLPIVSTMKTLNCSLLLSFICLRIVSCLIHWSHWYRGSRSVAWCRGALNNSTITKYTLLCSRLVELGIKYCCGTLFRFRFSSY